MTTFRIQPLDHEPTRFWCQRPGGTVRIVDIESHAHNGACDCEDFQFRKLPNLRTGTAPGPGTRCVHIDAVREWIAESAILGLCGSDADPRPLPDVLGCWESSMRRLISDLQRDRKQRRLRAWGAALRACGRLADREMRGACDRLREQIKTGEMKKNHYEI